MTERENMLKTAQQTLSLTTADQADVRVTGGFEGLTRFANNHIHQNVYESSLEVSFRAIFGKRIGVATTNDLSDEGLRQVIERAEAMAQVAAPNEEFVSLPAPAGEPLCCVDPVEATVDFGPENRAEAVKAMLDTAKTEQLNAAGNVVTGLTAVVVANSLGVEGWYRKSAASARVVMQGKSSSGYAEIASDDVNEMDFVELGRTAADKALQSENPRDVEPGVWTVILEPLAVTDMIGTLAMYDLHALAHQEGRSFTSERMGKQVCGGNINIWDDGCDARGGRMPIDFEGVPRQRVDFIKEGILTGVTYDSFTAGREAGVVNTGHALPPPNGWGPVPLNVFMNTGDYSVEEMVKNTERGLLVTRFHYTNMVHPVTTVFTGMTRDGTFLIENGEIVDGVKNLRFTQSILEALSRVDMIGSEGAQLEYAWAPALRIDGFNFSSGTQF